MRPIETLNKIIRQYVNFINRLYDSNLIKVFVIWFATSSIFSLNDFLGRGIFVRGNCWSFFENCKEILNLNTLPYSYDENILYTIILAIIFYSLYSLYNKKYLYTHISLFIILVFKYILVLFSGGVGNYDYYDIIIQTVFFISFSNVIWTLRSAFLFLYFLAGTIKIHEGWILGSYFSSMILGLPLIPNILIPIFTNLVIVMQILLPFLSLNKNKKLRLISLAYITFFHIYSTTIVEYRYPVTSVSLVIILFALRDNLDLNNKYNEFSSRFILNNKNILFTIIICCSLFAQLYPILFIKGDQKLTLEGNRYGLFMFEANHQFISKVTDQNNNKVLELWATDSANYRISISSELKKIKGLYCDKKNSDAIHWDLDHSINGSPFYRIINVNPCQLEYLSTSHNEWIVIDNPEIAYYSKKNVYGNHKQYKEVFYDDKNHTAGASTLKNFPINEKNSLQNEIFPILVYIEKIYWLMWILTLIYCIFWIFNGYTQKK